VSTISFELLKSKYLRTSEGEPVGMPKAKMDGKTWGVLIGAVALIFFFLNFQRIFNTELDVIGYLIYASMIIIPAVIISDKTLTKDEKERIWVIFILVFFVIFFWACFEQAGASLTLFADSQTNRHIGGWEMPSSWFQSINPLGIILLAPLFTMLWNALNKRKLEPS
jgi:POT family proton-dependent oligopeptide transporter